MATQMIVEYVGIIRTKPSTLFGVDYASMADTVEHLAGFAEGTGEDVSDY
jgi:hypothetical protein